MDQSCVADDPLLVAAPMEPNSLRDDLRDQLARHKWIASQHAGRDLGQEAVSEWAQKHWYGYLKARWLEHLQGLKYWMELNREAFGLLPKEFPHHPQLLGYLIDRLKCGCENLELICWAVRNNIPTDDVKHILRVIDVNALRSQETFSKYAS